MDGAEREDRGPLGAPFWRLWTAGIVNNLGDGALVVGVSLVASTLTRDPRLIAVVSASAMAPWLLITLPAGVLIDRVDRVAAVRTAQLLQAIAMAVLTLLTALHLLDVLVLAAFAFLVTAGDVVASNATQTVLPQIVAKERLVRANSLVYLGQTISFSLVGQALGGALFASSAALPFGLEAASLLGSAGLLGRLRAGPGPRESGVGARAAMVEGLRWLWRDRLLRTLALVLGANNVANQLGIAILVLFAVGPLHVPHAAFGLLLASLAVGGVVGGLASARLVSRIGQSTALIAALAANAVVLGAVGLCTDGWQAAGLLAVNGFCVTVWNVVAVSLRQSIVPVELLGRVNSAYRLIGWGAIPLGALAGGVIAHAFGLRAPFFVTGGVRLVVLLLAVPVLLGALSRLRPHTP